MSKVRNIDIAKKEKNDEFYTQLKDIERELVNYWDHFEGKTVLCNCDDPRVSNFFHYFSYKFKDLKLKKLIAVCYKNQDIDLFSQGNSERAIWLEYTGEKDEGTIPTVEQIGVNYLEGDGDFRSDECIELLKEADIVVTNPPFSLFREFVSQIVTYDKKFLILGNQDAISCKEIFPLIKENKIWFGKNSHGSNMEFGVPDEYPLYGSRVRRDEDGNGFITVSGIKWYTNLKLKKLNEEMILYRNYNSDDYPKYDNYDAINVNKTKDIPCDYDGVMGVPITFFDKYNLEQFEILGITESDGKGYSFGLWDDGSNVKHAMINGKRTYTRLFIRRKKR